MGQASAGQAGGAGGGGGSGGAGAGRPAVEAAQEARDVAQRPAPARLPRADRVHEQHRGGRVWQGARHRAADDPSRRFAIKCLLKAKLLAREQLGNCLNELSILRRIDHHAYLCNLFYASQDESTLCMCSDLMLGGTLQRDDAAGAGGLSV